MASTAPSIPVTTIIATTIGTVVTGVIAYAIYFDYKRRTDVDFRKQLKKESKRLAKIAKEEKEMEGKKKRMLIREAVDKANREGYPRDAEEVEGYFMEEVAEGERLCQDESQSLEAALCFFRALKVYPNSDELFQIYDKTVPKPILDVLAEMIAYDPTMSLRSAKTRPAAAEFDDDV